MIDIEKIKQLVYDIKVMKPSTAEIAKDVVRVVNREFESLGIQLSVIIEMNLDVFRIVCEYKHGCFTLYQDHISYEDYEGYASIIIGELIKQKHILASLKHLGSSK